MRLVYEFGRHGLLGFSLIVSLMLRRNSWESSVNCECIVTIIHLTGNILFVELNLDESFFFVLKDGLVSEPHFVVSEMMSFLLYYKIEAKAFYISIYVITLCLKIKHLIDTSATLH